MSGEAGGHGISADERSRHTFDDEDVVDMLRGIAVLARSPLAEDLAYAIATVPSRAFANSFNRKQAGSKRWLVDHLVAALGPEIGRILVVGGWHGLLSSLILDDPRLSVSHVTSLDLDPACEAGARAANRRHVEAGRFDAVTGDMYAFDYAEAARPRFDLVINTSCEHIGDLRAWLDRLPPDTAVVLQSNDYRREPDHVACVDSLPAFEALARLASVAFRGEHPTTNYRRFMLIGHT